MGSIPIHLWSVKCLGNTMTNITTVIPLVMNEMKMTIMLLNIWNLAFEADSGEVILSLFQNIQPTIMNKLAKIMKFTP